MNVGNIIKKIDLYKTAIECLDEIQKLDELEMKPIQVQESWEITIIDAEYVLNTLKRKQIKLLSTLELTFESKIN